MTVVKTYGPVFRWFAWHPVNTEDRGWRWLRMVYRVRETTDHGPRTSLYLDRYTKRFISTVEPIMSNSSTLMLQPRDQSKVLRD